MDFVFRIKAEKEEASKKLQEVEKNIANIRKEILQLNDKKGIEIPTEQAEARFKELNKLMVEGKKSFSILKDEVNYCEKQIAEFNKETGKTPDLLKSIADQATVENLRFLQETLGNAAGQIKEFGKGLIDSASQVGGYTNEIIRLSTSTEQGLKTVAFIKELATSSQEFSTESLLSAGATLTKFGLSVEELLPKVSNLADVFGQDVAEASEIVSRALSGTRGGVMQLATQYGLTTEKLKEYGAEMTKSGEVEDDSLQTKQAILKALQDLSNNADKGAAGIENYENSVAKFNNSLTELKSSLGEQVIPSLTKFNNYLADGVKYLNELPDRVKTAAIGIGGLAFAVTSAGAALAGIGAIILSAVSSVSSLVLSLTGATTVTAGLGVLWSGLVSTTFPAMVTGITAIGAAVSGFVATIAFLPAALSLVLASGLLLLKWTYDYKKSIEDLKKQDMQTVLDNQAEALQNLQQFYPGVTSGQEAFNQANKEGLENIAAQEGGLEKLKAIVKDLTADEMVLQEKRAQSQEELRKLQDAMSKVSPDSSAYFDYQDKVDAQKAVIAAISEAINKLREEKGAANEAAKSYLDKANAAGGKTPGSTITDTELSDEIKKQKLLVETQKQNYNQQIVNLENFKSTYNLTEMQILEIDKEIGDAREKQSKETEKAVADSLKAQETAYNDFKNSQKLLLNSNQISEKEYYSSLKLYLDSHSQDIQEGSDLWTKIYNDYYVGLNKLQKEEEKEAKRIATEKKKLVKEEQKDRQESVKAYEAELKKEEELKKKAEEEYRQRLERKKQAEKEINEALFNLTQSSIDREIKAIYDKTNAWRDAGINEIKLERFKYESIKKLMDDSLNDFKAKEEQKRIEIENTAKKIEDIEKQIAENKAKQAALDTYQVGGGLPLMEGFSALGSEANRLMQGETLHLDPYQQQKDEEKKLKEDEIKLEIELNDLKLQAKTLEEDLIKIKNQEKTATETLIASLNNASTALSNFSNNLKTPSSSNPSSDRTPSSGGGTSSNEAPSGIRTSGMNYSGIYTQKAIGQASEDKVRQMNQAYQTAYYGTNDPAERKLMQFQYASYAKGMGYSPEDALKIGFDNPLNDSMAQSVGGEHLKAIMKNIQDFTMNYVGGMVRTLQQTSSNIQNINNSSSSNTSIKNQYFLGDANITNNTPTPVQEAVKQTVSWQMGAKYFRGGRR